MDRISVNDEKPLVSVTITTYNSENTIEDVLNALLNQYYSLKRIEVIVVDDHSIDNTMDKVKAFMGKYRDQFYGFKLIIHDKNYGVSKARNDAIKLAKGKYILILDSDVVLPPNAITRMVSFLETYPEIGCCQLLLKGDSADLVSRWLYDVNIGKVRNIICCTAAAMIRREVIKKAGLYDETMGPPFSVDEDIEFGARIWRAGYRCIMLGDTVAEHLMIKRDRHLAKIEKSLKEPKLTIATYAKWFMNYFNEKHAQSWYKFLRSLPLKLRIRYILSSLFLPCLALLLLGLLIRLPQPMYFIVSIVLLASFLNTLMDFISSLRKIHKSMILALLACISRSIRTLGTFIHVFIKGIR